jgi:hypothetical protein
MIKKLIRPSKGPVKPVVTERKKLITKKNALAALTIMAEGDNTSFDILIDVLGMGDETFNDFVRTANDMNIRGEQIDIAHKYCGCSITELTETVAKCDAELVEYLNSNWKKAYIEQAVTSGAHENGHK